MPRELWLFTMHYPYGTGGPWLGDELDVLARHFDRIRLFPFHTGTPARHVLQGVEVEAIFHTERLNRPLALRHLAGERKAFVRLWSTARSTVPDAATFAQHRRELVSMIRQHLARHRHLMQQLAPHYDPERVRLYSYWGSDWATLLGLWKLQDPRVRFITRMHGFDLYRERAPHGWPMFQRFHLEQADRVLAASERGMKDLQRRYPGMAGKVITAPVASADHGPAPWAPAEALRIVSCSRLVELKRVHLIPEALKHLDRPTHWTHFGDGPERERIEAAITQLPPHIHVDLKGQVPNNKLMQWYHTHPVDAFVHVSSSEGGPVVLKEAASFGIPLIATDVGGVSEIVNEETGILLPADPTPAAIAEMLGGFHRSAWYGEAARKRVRAFWQARYSAEQVYNELAELLLAS